MSSLTCSSALEDSGIGSKRVSGSSENTTLADVITVQTYWLLLQIPPQESKGSIWRNLTSTSLPKRPTYAPCANRARRCKVVGRGHHPQRYICAHGGSKFQSLSTMRYSGAWENVVQMFWVQTHILLVRNTHKTKSIDNWFFSAQRSVKKLIGSHISQTQ